MIVFEIKKSWSFSSVDRYGEFNWSWFESGPINFFCCLDKQPSTHHSQLSCSFARWEGEAFDSPLSIYRHSHTYDTPNFIPLLSTSFLSPRRLSAPSSVPIHAKPLFRVLLSLIGSPWPFRERSLSTTPTVRFLNFSPLLSPFLYALYSGDYFLVILLWFSRNCGYLLVIALRPLLFGCRENGSKAVEAIVIVVLVSNFVAVIEFPSWFFIFYFLKRRFMVHLSTFREIISYFLFQYDSFFLFSIFQIFSFCAFVLFDYLQMSEIKRN